MNPNSINKKQADAQMTLYRLLRLENRENNFIFRDNETGTQLRVSYQHFPLQTIGHCDLLKTFWKFITTHYFKKIDQEELYRLNYIRNLFTRLSAHPPASLRNLHLCSRFYQQLKDLFQPSYLQELYNQYEECTEGRVHLKTLYLNWAGERKPILRKEKKIKKQMGRSSNSRSRKGMVRQKQLSLRQEELDQIIGQLQLSKKKQQIHHIDQQKDNIDEEIARLQLLLQNNAETNLDILDELEAQLVLEQQQTEANEKDMLSGTDAKCLQWLIHNLEQKQIAESISKIVTTERKDAESKFVIHYEKALNLTPQVLAQRSLKKMNQLRETSLLKFYRTAVKSTHSYICHNYAGFYEMRNQSSSAWQKNKEKDHFQLMKKIGSAPQQIRQSMEQFDICHHCKYLYLPQFLVTCKFISDRPCMPKISQSETDFAQDLSLQKGRVSQRFVAKHRNCMTGYARISQQFVCGRKFCLSCLKDNYGEQYMRSNNGICPFCEGICSCTRCLRNQKMNKLKAFFISLGGDLSKLQDESLIDQLPVIKSQLSLKTASKLIRPIKASNCSKSKKITKKSLKQSTFKQPRNKRYIDRSEKKSVGSQQIDKWSSTAEKEVQKTILWRRSRRYAPKIY